MAKQYSLFSKEPKITKAHGGSLAVGKRRMLRPLKLKQTHHVTLKSHHATQGRCLFKHKKMIISVMRKASALFQVRVYEHSVCSNHIHLLIKGPDRESIQNFFRVFAGHTAQKILKLCPLPPSRGGALPKKQGCAKNQRKFWSYLIYSRIVSWGKEYKVVTRYIQMNTLEALNIVAYQPRGRHYKCTKRDKNCKHSTLLKHDSS